MPRAAGFHMPLQGIGTDGKAMALPAPQSLFANDEGRTQGNLPQVRPSSCAYPALSVQAVETSGERTVDRTE